MYIYAGERLYAKWTPKPEVSDPLEVTFDGGTTWLPLLLGVENEAGVWSANETGTVHALLIASPSATENPAGTFAPGIGRYEAQIRYKDNPEIMIRDAGTVTIK